ncbi:LamG domain-containing protein [Candidatus Parvarchaeota archaeon]|nr:LamG domain-containing protein [Candidatus Parvarchaeota archaeon]
MSKKSSVRGYYSTRTTKLTTFSSKHSQSALEYMMTYGWAILIIVIVAAGLYSLGIFNPSSSAGTTITGFSGLGTPQSLCMQDGGLRLQLGNSQGYTINITRINITSNGITNSITPNQLISPQGTYIFYIPNVCGTSSGSRYSFTSAITYTEPGTTFQGPYSSTGTAAGTVSSTSLPAAVAYFDNYNHLQYVWGCPQWCLHAEFSYINATQSISGTNQSYTVTMWVESSIPFNTLPPPPNNSAVAQAPQAISGFGNTAVDGQEIATVTGRLFLHRCTSADSLLTPANPVSNFYDGHWHFIAFSVSTSAYIGMVDGLSGSVTLLKQYTDGPMFYFGGYSECYPQPFTGYISNVQLYNVALTAAQLTQIYQEGILGSPILVKGNGLVAWWTLNATVGGQAKDYSGNNFNGQLNNVTINSNYPSGQFGG